MSGPDLYGNYDFNADTFSYDITNNILVTNKECALSVSGNELHVISEQIGSTPGVKISTLFTLERNRRYVLRVTGRNVSSPNPPFLWIGTTRINYIKRETILTDTDSVVTAVFDPDKKLENCMIAILLSHAVIDSEMVISRIQFFSEIIENPYELTTNLIKSVDRTGVFYVTADTLTANDHLVVSDMVVSKNVGVHNIRSMYTSDVVIELTTSDNVIINGNLNVNGTSTYLETIITRMKDPLITLGYSSDTYTVNDGKDRGIEFSYFNGSQKKGFIGYDNDRDAITFLTNATNTNEVISGNLATVHSGNTFTSDISASRVLEANVTTPGSWFHLIPAGVILPFTSTTIPDGYLECDGRAISTTTYARLFLVIQYVYGGSGSTFNLPNMQGRIPLCKSNTYEIGTTGGSATITDVPAHTHTATTAGAGSHSHSTSTDGAHTHTVNDSGHTHTVPSLQVNGTGTCSEQDDTGSGEPNVRSMVDRTTSSSTTGITINSAGEHSHTISTASNHTHAVTVDSTGSASVNVMNPYIVITYIIKY